ncbi:probable RNA methyltransferase CG11342 isoform X2 [Wyeomyia smithii]|uniref:probable RNA methyltransferase CG11342 isoform X2 n=1 Tax=Wyeomyia smithii TaxID=174621 RepID=UPI0024681230|nr:probable RNA methyltransferase CG11342 isoform X2 [Wyeomyia smithii]
MVNDQIQHGSYRQYYDKFRPQDSRPRQLENCLLPWIAQRLTTGQPVRMLDIGCNSGKLTEAVLTTVRNALPEKCCSMLGVDIDDRLIEQANQEYQSVGLSFAQADMFAVAKGEAPGNPVDAALLQEGAKQFEIIFCFSILMYVHLNHGEEGLKSVLDYVCRRAKLLVLELQSWSKYRDHVRRMRREGGGDYPLYPTLIWKGDTVVSRSTRRLSITLKHLPVL